MWVLTEDASANTHAVSLTFLFRLISNLLSAKLLADEKEVLAGRVPTSFPEFVSCAPSSKRRCECLLCVTHASDQT